MNNNRLLMVAVAALVGLAMVAPAMGQPGKGAPAKPPGSASAPSSVPVAPPTASAPATAAPPPPSAQAPTAEDAERGGPDPANKAEAEERFKRGLELLKEEAWTAALAEFARSRELYPTRTATNNAAVCLRKLKRFDEALDMYETVLREFPNMPADKKEAAQREVAELRQLVGTIDITGAVPGASIVVDGKPRADYPIIDPLRVSSGTHSVRLFKQGFEPFEIAVEVAGGQTVKVVAKMPALVASGTLRIAEKTGKKLYVVLDGAVAGVTPWEGTIAIGDHVVQLLGDGDLGSMPSAAPVKNGELTSLTLEAESLEASVIVEATPKSATIRIDSVPVGRGIWDGRLRKGSHQIEVLAEGYFPKKSSVDLAKGDRQEVKLSLERDDSADKWQVPSKIVLDLTGGALLTPSFGGDVAASCGDSCSSGVGFGGLIMLNGAYEFGSGFGLGLSAGLLQAGQTIEGRDAMLMPVGVDPGLGGSANDDLRLRGVLAGANAGMRFLDRFPIRLRLGAGALISETRSVRTGAFTTRSGGSYTAPELGQSSTTAFVYIDPEASVGIKLGEMFELGAGVQGLILIPPSAPTWGSDENPNVVVEGDGLSSYSGEETTMGVMAFVVPGVSVRASF